MKSSRLGKLIDRSVLVMVPVGLAPLVSLSVAGCNPSVSGAVGAGLVPAHCRAPARGAPTSIGARGAMGSVPTFCLRTFQRFNLVPKRFENRVAPLPDSAFP